MTSRKQPGYTPNFGKTYNRYLMRWRIPWRLLSMYERRRRYEQAKRANQHVFRIAHVTSYAVFSTRQSAWDKYQPMPSRASLGRRMPPLFGSSERTHILAILWLTGPITVRELARARRVDAAGTFHTVDRLIRAGLVVKSAVGRRHIGLNYAHSARHALGTLLSALVRHYDVRFPRIMRYRATLPTKSLAADSPPVEDHVFGSAVRSQLIMLLGVVGSADSRQLCRLLGQNYASTAYALKALERDQVLRSQRVGIRRVYVLSDGYPGGLEYRRYVSSVARALPRYNALSKAIEVVTKRYR